MHRLWQDFFIQKNLNNPKQLQEDSQIKIGNFYGGKTLQPRLVNQKIGSGSN